MKRYFHGGNVYEYERKYGKKPLDFSANINPLGMPETARAAYAEALEYCPLYPDPDCSELRNAIAVKEGVPPEWIECGNGAADLLFRIMWAAKPAVTVLTAPSFEEYEKAALSCGSEVRYRYLSEKNGFKPDDDTFSNLAGAGVLIISNPDNPVGNAATPDFIERTLKKCEKENCLLIADECFADFVSDNFGSVNFLKNFKNLAVLKAFTKFYAMPGLRLGYLMTSNACLLEKTAAAGQTWSVSVPAQLCGTAALSDDGYARRSRELIGREKPFLTKYLKEAGAVIYGSEANYVFFRFPSPDLGEFLEKKGITIKDCSGYEGLGKGYYRIAVKSREENKALIKAVGEVSI